MRLLALFSRKPILAHFWDKQHFSLATLRTKKSVGRSMTSRIYSIFFTTNTFAVISLWLTLEITGEPDFLVHLVVAVNPLFCQTRLPRPKSASYAISHVQTPGRNFRKQLHLERSEEMVKAHSCYKSDKNSNLKLLLRYRWRVLISTKIWMKPISQTLSRHA